VVLSTVTDSKAEDFAELATETPHALEPVQEIKPAMSDPRTTPISLLSSSFRKAEESENNTGTSAPIDAYDELD